MMQNTPAISLHNVGKSYSKWDSPSERFWALFGRKRAGEPFWALDDVTFEIPKGMAIGILGRNGAGKSTLMQIMAGTVQPTVGTVAINGRLSPLLELGAGFNLDFTGWENVELAGTILGLSPAEVQKKLDSIAAFADIGAFMERPVRIYSSGMFARLAFSVAVHVDPDILLVDEILSVGDIGFQQRCLARLREMRERGLTLVFVSHAPDAVKSVCTHAAFLHQGKLMQFGKAEPVVDSYMAFVREAINQERLLEESHWGKIAAARSHLPASLRYGSGHVQIRSVEVRDEAAEPRRAFELGAPVLIDVEVESRIDIKDLSVSFLIRDATGIDMLGTTTFDEHEMLPPLHAGDVLRVRFQVPNCLRPGSYGISVAVCRVSQRDYSDNVIFDQGDGVASFLVTENANRPVHYKVHQDITVAVVNGPDDLSVARSRRTEVSLRTAAE